MFAGGGAIPLEALRLGCEAYAIELNPVAHLIELCTLVYPQKYGKLLADAVGQWGKWVFEQVRSEVGDLYPPIPLQAESKQPRLEVRGNRKAEARELTPVAYLWTRTVRCPNQRCGGTVPIVRQTWLNRKEGRLAALRMVPDHRNKP